MKKFFYLLVCLFVSMACFTSCSSDDDDNDGGDPSTPKATVTIQETSNQLIMTSVWKDVLTQTMTATFGSNNILTTCILEESYSNKKYADEAWASLEGDKTIDMSKFSRNGNVIIEDMTEDFAGLNKAQVKSIFEATKAQNEKGGVK